VNNDTREALYYAGWCYERGFSVEKNVAEAVRMFKLSTDKDYPKKLLKYGICLRLRIGVEQDDVKSMPFLEKAALLGHVEAIHV
jgi:TPR repeat protein